MSAASFAATCKTVSQLKLRPTALYLLAVTLDDGPEDLFSPAAIKAILKVAENEWVNDKRALASQSLIPPPETDVEEEEERDAHQRGGDQGHTRRSATGGAASSAHPATRACRSSTRPWRCWRKSRPSRWRASSAPNSRRIRSGVSSISLSRSSTRWPSGQRHESCRGEGLSGIRTRWFTSTSLARWG